MGHGGWGSGVAVAQERGGLEASEVPAPHLSAQLLEREEKGRPSGQTAWPDSSTAARPALAKATWDKSVTSSAQSWQTCHSGGKVPSGKGRSP